MSRYDATVGQIGFRLILQVLDRDPLTGELRPADVSAGTKEIIVLRPDDTNEIFSGVNVIFSPAPVGNGTGTDGFIEARTTSATLTMTGTYQVAAYIDYNSVSGTSQTATLEVGRNIKT